MTLGGVFLLAIVADAGSSLTAAVLLEPRLPIVLPALVLVPAIVLMGPLWRWMLLSFQGLFGPGRKTAGVPKGHRPS